MRLTRETRREMMGRKLARLFLPVLLPAACAWVARQERRILAEGVPLDSAQLADACALGIAEPARIRLLCQPRAPLPHHPLIRQLGLLTGTLSTEAAGMAMRYGIFLRTPFHRDHRLLVHELTHTLQYERLGGIRPFLRQYLHECLTVGYHESPLELEAAAAAHTQAAL